MTEDRDATIVKRRRAGESFPAIAATFGKSGPWAWAIVKRLAPDLLGRKAKGTTTTPRAPRATPERHKAARPTVDVPSNSPLVEGFSVRTTIQDVRHGRGLAFAHGIDERSNAVIFTITTRKADEYRDLISKGTQPVVEVQGHDIVRYDGATGPWSNKAKGAKA